MDKSNEELVLGALSHYIWMTPKEIKKELGRWFVYGDISLCLEKLEHEQFVERRQRPLSKLELLARGGKPLIEFRLTKGGVRESADNHQNFSPALIGNR